MKNSILPLIPSILNIYESEETACAAKKDKENSGEEKDIEGLLEKYEEAAGASKEKGSH